MKRRIATVAAFAAFTLLFVHGVLGFVDQYSGKPTSSPTHVVAVYVDGLNNYDFRETCTAIHAPHVFPALSKCEAYFGFNTAFQAYSSGPSVYRVVAHSAKVWTQDYRGRSVRLAVVRFANVTVPAVLTAHLRFIDGAWRIVAVS